MGSGPEEYDFQYTTPCVMCGEMYKIGLYADYVGTFKIKCKCESEFRIRQNAKGVISVNHIFRIPRKAKLRLVVGPDATPKSQIAGVP